MKYDNKVRIRHLVSEIAFSLILLEASKRRRILSLIFPSYGCQVFSHLKTLFSKIHSLSFLKIKSFNVWKQLLFEEAKFHDVKHESSCLSQC